MQNGPETRFWQRRGQRKRRGAQIQRDLGAQDGDDHFRDKIEGGDPGEQTQQQEQAAEDLRHCHEMCREFGPGKTQFGEAAYTLVRVYEFQQSFPKEDAAGE